MILCESILAYCGEYSLSLVYVVYYKCTLYTAVVILNAQVIHVCFIQAMRGIIFITTCNVGDIVVTYVCLSLYLSVRYHSRSNSKTDKY